MTVDTQPRLLIVDDSRAQRFIVRKLLDGQAVTIAGEAGDGDEGVERYGELLPDLVLLDLVMPGTDGPEALDRILTLHPDAKVIITSSLGDEEIVRGCLARGAVSFLQKPLSADTLVRAVQQALSRG